MGNSTQKTPRPANTPSTTEPVSILPRLVIAATARTTGAQRQTESERARAWALANPERVRENQRRWNAENQEKVRQSKRDYYHRHRDELRVQQRERNATRRTDPVFRQAEREYDRQRSERKVEQQRERRSTPEGREAHNREQRERTRWNRRRLALGLPKVPRHRWTKSEREQHEAEAAAFFRKLVTVRRMRELLREEQEVGAQARIAAQPDAVLLERLTVALDVASRNTEFVRRYLATEHAQRVSEEVRLDSIARVLNGEEPYDNTRETIRRGLPMIRSFAVEIARHELRSLRAQHAGTRGVARSLPVVEVPEDEPALTQGLRLP